MLQPRCRDSEPTQSNFPLSEGSSSDILIYSGSKIRGMLADSSLSSCCSAFNSLASEWVRAWHTGPGVLVIKNAFPDTYMVDAVSREFESVVRSEEIDGGKGDHFAKAGNNSRIWNANEKLALKNPKLYCDYYK